jgi:hypothetical protein
VPVRVAHYYFLPQGLVLSTNRDWGRLVEVQEITDEFTFVFIGARHSDDGLVWDQRQLFVRSPQNQSPLSDGVAGWCAGHYAAVVNYLFCAAAAEKRPAGKVTVVLSFVGEVI